MPSKSPLIKVLALFMVGIILPTGFLVYLGILSIHSETLLLRKESQERVGKTGQAIQDQAQGVVAEALTRFAQLSKTAGGAEKKSLSGVYSALNDFRRANGEVSLLLLVDGGNHLIYPIQELRRQAVTALMPLPLEQRHRLEESEQAEFKNHDYASAIASYRSLLKVVDSPRWKAILLTSVAGSLVKQGQFDAAEAQYQEILSRYSPEFDLQGYPFGLVIASQLGELQQAKGRLDLAAASHLRVYQDLLSGRWDLTWEESQFFMRRLATRMENLRTHMSGADQGRWQALQSQYERLKGVAVQASDFMRSRWPGLQRTLREQDRSGSPYYVFTDLRARRAIAYAPSYATRTDSLEWAVIAEVDTTPVIARLQKIVDPLTSAANLAYRLELSPKTLLAQSDRKPEGKRWPMEAQLTQTFPVLKLAIAPVSDVPVEQAAARRRQVYVGMVFLAAVVILIALYATWYAVSREIEVAQLKARFVAGISHELKTPLSIIGFIGQKLQLGRYESVAEVQDYYAMIAEETSRLKSLIDDVLDFSRLMENRQPYQKEPTDLVRLVRETAERFRHSVKEGEIRLDCRCDPASCQARVDPEAMSRVILNLLDNAAKYSPPDRKVIALSLKAEGGTAVIEVADQGYGIPSEEQKLVFDRFYRGRSASDHQSIHGTGLGLSIVQHIVAAHSGHIDLQSTLGKGSIFTIRIPRD